ncbi:MAG: hypothetical protein ACREOZ_00395, partial [Gloeomargaritales cyanobacterium]
VLFAGTVAPTAANPSWSFSREIVKRIDRCLPSRVVDLGSCYDFGFSIPVVAVGRSHLGVVQVKACGV